MATAPLSDMISCGLIKRLLDILDGQSPKHRIFLDNTCRAYLITALKAMNEAAPDKIGTMLDSCDSWADYKHQRHDLFIEDTSNTMERLARLTGGGAPLSAGYLTSVPSNPTYGNDANGDTAAAAQPPPPTRIDMS
ncbi:hypothetical protein ACOME3_001145 [Neoechinorhynchus agilis]